MGAISFGINMDYECAWIGPPDNDLMYVVMYILMYDLMYDLIFVSMFV